MRERKYLIQSAYYLAAFLLLTGMSACSNQASLQSQLANTALPKLHYTSLTPGELYKLDLNEGSQQIPISGTHFPIAAYELPLLENTPFYFDVRATINFGKPLQRNTSVVEPLLALLDENYRPIQIIGPPYRLFLDWRRAYYGDQVRPVIHAHTARYLLVLANPATIGEKLHLRFPVRDSQAARTRIAIHDKHGEIGLTLILP
jgi:hypothetical protein